LAVFGGGVSRLRKERMCAHVSGCKSLNDMVDV
jgi:hypothetical protein